MVNSMCAVSLPERTHLRLLPNVAIVPRMPAHVGRTGVVYAPSAAQTLLSCRRTNAASSKITHSIGDWPGQLLDGRIR